MEPLCLTANLLEVVESVLREVGICCLNRNSFI